MDQDGSPAGPAKAARWRVQGVGRIAQGDLAGARSCLEQAVQACPTDADSHAELASLALRRGDHGQARGRAETALAIAPDCGAAHRVLAYCDQHDGRLDLAAQRLGAWLGLRRPEPASRRLALAALGSVLQAQGRLEAARAAYMQMNRETRQLFAPRFARSGLFDSLARLQADADAFDPARWSGGDARDVDPTARHVFVLGFMRSGTTLVEQMLCGLPGVVSLEEQDTLALGVQRYLGAPDTLNRLAGIDPSSLTHLRADYWARVRRFGVEPQGLIFVDKNPLASIRLPLIARMFPKARILFCIRRPEAVVASCFRQTFALNDYTYQMLDFATSAKLYDAVTRLALSYIAKLSIRPLFVRHEQVVRSPSTTAKEICNYLDLPYDARMLDVGSAVSRGGVSSPSAIQLSDGIWSAHREGWRSLFGQDLGDSPMLTAWAGRLGYAPGA